MNSEVQTFFSDQARLLSQGRICAMARAYSVPLPIFLRAEEGVWNVLASRQAVVETFFAKHGDVLAGDGGRLRALVTAEHWKGGRCRAEVAWLHVGRDGRKHGRTIADYYLSQGPDGLIVDMLVFHAIAFPRMNKWFLDNALQLHPGETPL